MTCCSGRTLLIVLCCLQLISTVERQVFEFLGYLWGPIIGNFLHIIFVIIGLFGACQYRHRILAVYCIWSIIWLVWNAFVICFYLEVGILSRDLPILNIGTGNKSWWINNGIGCHGANVSSIFYWITDGCVLQYYYVEVIHAGVQCVLAVLSFCTACFVIYAFSLEDDITEPVHNELEYIRMRYRSPARQSFRGNNKAYENLTVRSDCTMTTADGTFRPIPLSADLTPHSSDKSPIGTDLSKHSGDPRWGEVVVGTTTPLKTEFDAEQTT